MWLLQRLCSPNHFKTFFSIVRLTCLLLFRHGMLQMKTQIMDGAPGLTQRPVMPGGAARPVHRRVLLLLQLLLRTTPAHVHTLVLAHEAPIASVHMSAECASNLNWRASFPAALPTPWPPPQRHPSCCCCCCRLCHLQLCCRCSWHLLVALALQNTGRLALGYSTV
jgi:hypothetical protein